MAQKRLSTLLLILILKQFKLFRLMKKYLISFVAATALILAFTGCSKSNDLYNQGIIDEKNKEDQAKQDQQNELAINEAYATAFEKAFGPVGSNVDWGFSRKSSVLSHVMVVSPLALILFSRKIVTPAIS